MATRSAVQTIGFMDLTPEIRNLIYRELLVDPVRVVLNSDFYNRGFNRPLSRPIGSGRYLDILRTSRKVYEEAMLIFYQENTFHFDFLAVLTVLYMLKDKSRSLITKLSLTCRPGHRLASYAVLRTLPNLTDLRLEFIDLEKGDHGSLTGTRRTRGSGAHLGIDDYQELVNMTGLPVLLALRGIKRLDVVYLPNKDGRAFPVHKTVGFEALLRSVLLLPRENETSKQDTKTLRPKSSKSRTVRKR